MNKLVDVGGSIVDLTTWDDLKRACEEGLLNENNYIELKAGLPPAKANVETSRDLASLTVLGGVVIVGVREASDGKPDTVEGVEACESVRTRLAAVASGSVQPAVACEIYTLAHPTEAGRGCVVCVIPPSATAPHRADERYWGRSSHGKRVLSDAEVSDLFAKRRNREDTFLQDLIGLAATFDSEPASERMDGHTYLLARPLQAHMSPTPWTDEHPAHMVARAGLAVSAFGGTGFEQMRYFHTHPHGLLAATYGPEFQGFDSQFIKALFEDSGAVRVASGRGAVNGGAGNSPDTTGVLNVPATVVLVHHFIQMVRLVASEKALAGLWQLGVHLDGMGYATALTPAHAGPSARFPEQVYTHAATVDRTELDDPAAVTERLLRPLTRGLGRELIFPYTDLRSVFGRYQ